MSNTTPILFVDAYDSFTRNIIALLYECIPSAQIVTIHIDTNVQQEHGIGLQEFVSSFTAIVLGPGPGDPRKSADSGLFAEILAIAADNRTPVLGICLGFQVLCLQYGHAITRLLLPHHGRSRSIHSTGVDIFQNLRYGPDVNMICYNSLGVRSSDFRLPHSPAASSLPPGYSPPLSGASTPLSTASFDSDIGGDLELLAWDDDGFAQAVRHPTLPFWGLQFHPESCACCDGTELLSHWWQQAERYLAQNPLHRHASLSHSLNSKLWLDAHAQPCNSNKFIHSHSERHVAGVVTWIMNKFKRVASQNLSELCHESSGKSAVAMLESTVKGRYCIYAFVDPDTDIVEYASGRLVTRRGQRIVGEERMNTTNALGEVQRRTKAMACTGGCPAVPFWGGWIGHISYEMGLDLLDVSAPSHRQTPDFSFLLVERSIVLDQRTRDICVQSIRPGDELWVKTIRTKLQKLNQTGESASSRSSRHDLCNVLSSARIIVPDHDSYTQQIQICQEELYAGNSYELCLTDEAQIDITATSPTTSYHLYRNMTRHNPVPFAAYLHFPSSNADVPNGTTILSTSPEQFISWHRTGVFDMIPMKGTVQRTPATTPEDACRILQSPKESAENLMIADLIRHDLYGIVGCQPYPILETTLDARFLAQRSMRRQSRRPSSTLPNQEHADGNITSQEGFHQEKKRDPVRILALNSIRQFDTVYQLVSHVRAHPPATLDVTDPRAVIAHNHSSLRHVLPPGSMTGAPKKRSCEILQKLEQRNRGVYSGIIGYMDVGGGGCWSVAIRTAFSSDAEDYVEERIVNDSSEDEDIVEIEKRKIWRVGAGGAVTVLSDVEGEWEEMMGKLGNVLKGFQVVKEEEPVWRPE